jgi:hypothetical protein
MIGTAARRDDGDRSGAVVFAPDAQVLGDIDALAVRPGLRVQVGQQPRGSGVCGDAIGAAKQQARYALQSHPTQNRLQRQFTFTGNNYASAGGQILVRIVGRLRSAHDHLPAAGRRPLQDRQRIGAGHQVGVDAERGGPLRFQDAEQRFTRAERGIVSLHTEPRAAQIRREVEQPQRRIRLHDLKLFRVLVEKIPVS